MREMVCIVCPNGCRLKIDDEGKVAGNMCPRGAEYAVSELTHPTRVVTSTVKVNGAMYKRCPVKTNGAIPKEKIFDAMKLLENVTLTAPVHIGDVVIGDVLGTGIDFVASKNMEESA